VHLADDGRPGHPIDENDVTAHLRDAVSRATGMVALHDRSPRA